MAGIADWLAFGLPTEGKQADKPRAGHSARRDVPTCDLTSSIDDARTAMRTARWDSALVTDRNGIVLGRVRAGDLDGGEQTVEAIMEAGPTTVRQSEYLDTLLERMRKREVADIIVTNSIGELVGVLVRDEAERHLEELDPS